MSMNQEGTTTVTDKDTSSLIETLKATNEELLKHVARKQDILASLSGEQVHYRLDGLTCPDCRHELKEIGSFCARQERSSQGQENRPHPAPLQVLALQ